MQFTHTINQSVNFKNRYFSLYSQCMPVKGAYRAIICDLARGRYKSVPNELIDILESMRNTSIEQVIDKYKDIQSTIKEYIEFLITNDFALLSSRPFTEDHFPVMDFTYESSSVINNSIIEISEITLDNLKNILKQLEDMRCQSILFRSHNTLSVQSLNKIFNALNAMSFRSVELMFKYSKLKTGKIISKLKFPMLRKVIIHSAYESNSYLLKSGSTPMIFTKKKYTGPKDCGTIELKHMSCNLPTFSESQCHNSCLNKKISIDQKGEIKNCPSMENTFGNITEVKLKDAVERKKFKVLWDITKDSLDVCKDCEYRYICTDCMAFKENIYSKPLKCNYNPYKGKWEQD